MDNHQHETFQGNNELFLTPKDKTEIAGHIDDFKTEIMDSLDNLSTELKRTIRKAVWTVAIIQYFAIVSAVWAMLYYMYY